MAASWSGLVVSSTLHCPFELLDADGDLFDRRLVVAGVHAGTLELGWPGVLELPDCLGRVGLIEHVDGAVVAGAIDVALLDFAAPLPQLHCVLGRAALERDVVVLDAPRQLGKLGVACLAGVPVLDHVLTRPETAALAEGALEDTLDVDVEVIPGQWIVACSGCHLVLLGLADWRT